MKQKNDDQDEQSTFSREKKNIKLLCITFIIIIIINILLLPLEATRNKKLA